MNLKNKNIFKIIDINEFKNIELELFNPIIELIYKSLKLIQKKYSTTTYKVGNEIKHLDLKHMILNLKNVSSY